MYDYSEQLEAFHKDKVRLSKNMADNLVKHRTSNEDRLISRLPELEDGIRISKQSFKSQGSFAMRTIIQTKFSDEEYDIDDGVVLFSEDLVDDDGKAFTPSEVKELVRKALKDKRFKKQPVIKPNCVRVFYAEEDEEKHHVDFPVYREYQDGDSSDYIRELAGQDKWIKSNPTQINVWFEDEIQNRNSGQDEAGSQLRIVLRLLKRFCRSRSTWDMPNGLKLTMLAVECSEFSKRLDQAFRVLLESLASKLQVSLEVENLADTEIPKAKLTRTSRDSNMEELRDRIFEALGKLEILDSDNCSRENARKAWDWIFKSDGYFDDYDDDKGDDKSGPDNSGGIDKGIAIHTPTKPVDVEGGGRYGK